MIQEIIVFALFGFIIAYYLYRFFFRKEKSAGGCDKCASSKTKNSLKSKGYSNTNKQS